MLETLFEGKERLDGFSRKVGNALSPVFREFGGYRKRRLREHIAAGKDPYGKAYSPLNPAYARRKRKKYGSKPILEASGKAISTHKTYYNNASGLYSETLEADHAKHHQYGTKTMSRRRYIPDEADGLPKEDEVVLVKLIKNRIKQNISNT